MNFNRTVNFKNNFWGLFLFKESKNYKKVSLMYNDHDRRMGLGKFCGVQLTLARAGMLAAGGSVLGDWGNTFGCSAVLRREPTCFREYLEPSRKECSKSMGDLRGKHSTDTHEAFLDWMVKCNLTAKAQVLCV